MSDKFVDHERVKIISSIFCSPNVACFILSLGISWCNQLLTALITFQDLIEAMEVGALRRLAVELLRRQPAAFADVVNGELAGGGDQPPSPDPDDDTPEWCNCGHCIVMPTQEENKCCTTVRRPCISRTNIFRQVVTDGNVLEIAMRYREDVLVLNNVRDNQSFRHAAYRQYVLWQHGRLGRGNRRVVPSCCVVAIRTRFPSPNGVYTGYRPARL